MMDNRRKAGCGQIQSRHSDGQVETSWPSAPRVEIEHPVDSLDQGPMRVAGNDDVDPARERIELQCFDVVQDVDAAPTGHYHLVSGLLFAPGPGSKVPPDANTSP